MSWQDKMKEEMYFQNSLRARDAEDLERRIQNTDNFFNAIERKLNQPSPPPPPPKSSSGGSGVGLLVAGAAVAGGAYLFKKFFGKDNKNKA